MRAEKRRREPTPDEISNGHLVAGVAGEEVVDQNQATPWTERAAHVLEERPGIAPVDEGLDPVREVHLRGQRIPAEVSPEPPAVPAPPSALVLLAAYVDAEPLGIAALEEIEEAPSNAAAQVEDARPGRAQRIDLPKDELVNVMKRARAIDDTMAPDRPVENALASSLTAREKRAGVLVVVTRDVVRVLRHRRSLAGRRSGPRKEGRSPHGPGYEVGLLDFSEAM